MKIVLSRKGFDSGSGGAASPIFADGSILSLPIPDRRAACTYAEIGKDGLMGRLAEDLSKGRVRAGSPAHLDPDLDREAIPRMPGWRGSLGQTDSARSHLDSQGVGPGDLFLFFGWFRDAVENADGRWRFAPGGRNVHAFFGWLQVEEVLPLPTGIEAEWAHAPWLSDHPHVRRGPEPKNAVYVASEQLVLPGLGAVGLPGAGTFSRLSSGSVLTEAGSKNRSLWRLPAWFNPSDGLPPLTYHGSPARWSRDGDGILLESVGRGQEFVLDCSGREAAAEWIARLLSGAAPGALRQR